MILLFWFLASAVSLLLAIVFGGESAIWIVVLIAISVIPPLAYYDVNH